MPSTNAELVRRFYAEADPLSALDTLIDPAAEFDFTAVYPDQPVLKGTDQARSFRADGPWAELRFEPERFLEATDGRVVVFVRAIATGRESGVPIESPPLAHMFTIRNGLLVRFAVYGDRAAALRAAGLDA